MLSSSQDPFIRAGWRGLHSTQFEHAPECLQIKASARKGIENDETSVDISAEGSEKSSFLLQLSIDDSDIPGGQGVKWIDRQGA